MAKKKSVAKASKVEPKSKPAPRSVVSKEKLVKNGTVMNRGVIGVHRFPIKTKFFLMNESYTGEFAVTEETKDSGTDHRRIRGDRDDVVVSLSYLQSQYALGNLKFFDEQGNVINHEDQSI